jgi:hypothetical protein
MVDPKGHFTYGVEAIKTWGYRLYWSKYGLKLRRENLEEREFDIFN